MNSSLVIHSLKRESKLRLQLPMQGALAIDEPKVSCVSTGNIQSGRIRLRMVQHIGCVQAKLKALGLGEPDRFADIRIKAPTARPDDRAQSQCRHSSWLSV